VALSWFFSVQFKSWVPFQLDIISPPHLARRSFPFSGFSFPDTARLLHFFGSSFLLFSKYAAGVFANWQDGCGYPSRFLSVAETLSPPLYLSAFNCFLFLLVLPWPFSPPLQVYLFEIFGKGKESCSVAFCGFVPSSLFFPLGFLSAYRISFRVASVPISSTPYNDWRIPLSLSKCPIPLPWRRPSTRLASPPPVLRSFHRRLPFLDLILEFFETLDSPQFAVNKTFFLSIPLALWAQTGLIPPPF